MGKITGKVTDLFRWDPEGKKNPLLGTARKPQDPRPRTPPEQRPDSILGPGGAAARSRGYGPGEYAKLHPGTRVLRAADKPPEPRLRTPPENRVISVLGPEGVGATGYGPDDLHARYHGTKEESSGADELAKKGARVWRTFAESLPHRAKQKGDKTQERE